MWKQAIEDAITVTKANIARFDGQFPHVSESDGIFELNTNTDWTDGFWSGILWLSYEYSGDGAFAEAAARTVDSFKERIEAMSHLDHHDIGFLYSLSSKAKWMIEKDENAKRLTLQAADVLLNRWRPEGEYIQAWGPKGHPTNGGRIIIDCLLNLPLLYWAYQQTGEARYRDIALLHAKKSQRYLVRGDASSYHTFHFVPETGEPIGGSTHQGYSNGSTWTRGQAWGIYGFALSYRYTGEKEFLETARRLARYFVEHLPEDEVAYWDFDVPVTPDTYRDSSASAIAACGMLEIISHLDANDPDYAYLQDAVNRSMASLVKNYSTIGEKDAQGFIKHGSYYVRGNVAPDGFTIWGDYYYLEALMRLEKGHKGYWYE